MGKPCSLALQHLGIAPGNFIPVDDVPPRGEVVGAAVLVLEVVSVLPYIVAHDGIETIHQRAILVGGGYDRERAVRVTCEPDPAGAKAPGSGIVKGGLEPVKGAKGLLDGTGKFAGWLPAAVGLHDLPEQRVIRMTTSIVLHTRANVVGNPAELPQQIINTHTGKRGVLHDVVQVGNVGGMVLVVMQIHRLRINVGLQRAVVIW
jgi:hypothetical protein